MHDELDCIPLMPKQGLLCTLPQGFLVLRGLGLQGKGAIRTASHMCDVYSAFSVIESSIHGPDEYGIT